MDADWRLEKLKEYQQKRKLPKTLPDGEIVIECRCGQSIARTVTIDGHRKFKVTLNGSTRTHHKPNPVRTEDDELIEPDDSIEAVGTECQGTGGRCSKTGCSLSHTFSFDEVSQYLGLERFSLAMASLGMTPDTYGSTAGYMFLAHFVIRTDGHYGKTVRYYREFPDSIKPSHLVGHQPPVDDTLDEIDPFVNE